MRALRAVVPVAAIASVVVLVSVLYALGYHEQYHALLQHWGALPFRVPFLDMHAVTSAVECHRLGFDVYVQNPCDMFQRPHGYSPVWLWLAILPITTAWDNILGIATVLLFLVALLFLPPRRGWRQTAIIALGTVSSVVAYALERSNADLLMFALATISMILNQRCGFWRMIGYAIAFFAGTLKYYPAALLILAVRERLGVFIAIGFIALGVIALWFALDGRDILRGMANIPTTSYFDDNIFGVRDLPFGLAQLFGLGRLAAVALLVVLLAALLGCAVLLASRDGLVSRIRSLTEAEATCLLTGCVLIVSCFLAAQNSLYRAIYLLFVLPGLTALARYPATVGLIIILMWTSGLRALIDALLERFGVAMLPGGIAHAGIWLVRELAWWFVITMLSALMLRLVWDSRARQDAGCVMVAST
jgi:hypothetical protein